MRKITKEATIAFFNNQNYKNSNTQVIATKDYVELRLYNNIIAFKNTSGTYISDAGWKTNTTKERLNGILNQFSKSLFQKNGIWYLKSNNDMIPTELPTRQFERVW